MCLYLALCITLSKLQGILFIKECLNKTIKYLT